MPEDITATLWQHHGSGAAKRSPPNLYQPEEFQQ
jgi:hypothetical protein